MHFEQPNLAALFLLHPLLLSIGVLKIVYGKIESIGDLKFLILENQGTNDSD
jgi:hypothetical protein